MVQIAIKGQAHRFGFARRMVEVVWLRTPASAKPILIVLAVGFLLFLLRFIYPPWFTAVSIQRLQLIVLPFVVYALSRIRFAGVIVPRLLLIAGSLAAVGAAVHTYLVFTPYGDDLAVLARLAGDDTDSTTRILREKINAQSAVLSSDSEIRSIPRQFSSHREVEQFLREEPRIGAVIWGNQRWLQLSFRPRPAVKISSLSDAFIGRERELMIVLQVPVVGVQHQPADSTARYLSSLIAGMRKEVDPTSPLFVAEFDSGHAAFAEAASMIGTISNAHRALPFWRIGTDLLLRFIAGHARERALLSCAERSFGLALRYLGMNENRELRAAILNNLGVLRAVDLATSGEWERGHEVGELLSDSVRTERESNIYKVAPYAPRIARQNLQTYRGLPSRGSRDPQQRKRGQRAGNNNVAHSVP